MQICLFWILDENGEAEQSKKKIENSKIKWVSAWDVGQANGIEWNNMILQWIPK